MPKRVSPSGLKLTFLTDNIKLTEETSEAKSRRADFVQAALQPVLSIFTRIQEDCTSLDNELQFEIISAFHAMRISAERKFQTAAKKLIQAQRHLEELEEEFERSDAVSNIMRELDLYSDKVNKGERQYSTLEDQKRLYENGSKLLTAEIKRKNGVLKQLSRENIQLHREIGSVQLPRITPRADVPLANIFKSVPFEVFTELSSQEVGRLTVAQIQAFIAYKKHIESLKEQVEVEKMKTQFQKLANIGDRSKERLEEFFVQCVATYAQMEMGSYRSVATTRSLEGTFFPLPPTTQFETMLSARLFEIDQSMELSLKRQNRKHPAFTRQDLSKVPVQFVIRVLLSKKKCLERVQYFLTHGNTFRESELEKSGDSRESGEVKWSLREE